MTYAGLTTADKPALLDAKANGKTWVVFYNDKSMRFFDQVPYLGGTYSVYCMEIDKAIAQIAEMESAEKSNECEYCTANGTIWSRFTSVCYRQDGEKRFDEREVNVKFCPNCGRNLASPYTEGATDEG